MRIGVESAESDRNAAAELFFRHLQLYFFWSRRIHVTEEEWTKGMARYVRKALNEIPDNTCQVEIGKRIPYAYEIRSYNLEDDPNPTEYPFETDLLILDRESEERWKPRVIVEAKLKGISTHDAITYSQKAHSHKTVHPYLRYGVIIGDRKKRALPGRLYRHGAHFDFMMSFESRRPTGQEKDEFLEIIRTEIDASRKLEKIIYDNRKHDRDRYTILHKKLSLT